MVKHFSVFQTVKFTGAPSSTFPVLGVPLPVPAAFAGLRLACEPPIRQVDHCGIPRVKTHVSDSNKTFMIFPWFIGILRVAYYNAYLYNWVV